MMVVVKKWKVTVKFTDREVVIYVNDNFIANALRTVAGLDFTANGLEQPVSISVSE